MDELDKGKFDMFKDVMSNKNRDEGSHHDSLLRKVGHGIGHGTHVVLQSIGVEYLPDNQISGYGNMTSRNQTRYGEPLLPPSKLELEVPKVEVIDPDLSK
jgi:hypothetical protein